MVERFWDWLDHACACNVEDESPSDTSTMEGAAKSLVRAAKLRAVQINTQHNVVGNAKKISTQTWEGLKVVGAKSGDKLRELENKHQVVDAFKVVASETKYSAKAKWSEFDEKHKILASSSQAFVKGANFVAEQLEPKHKDKGQYETISDDV